MQRSLCEESAGISANASSDHHQQCNTTRQPLYDQSSSISRHDISSSLTSPLRRHSRCRPRVYRLLFCSMAAAATTAAAPAPDAAARPNAMRPSLFSFHSQHTTAHEFFQLADVRENEQPLGTAHARGDVCSVGKASPSLQQAETVASRLASPHPSSPFGEASHGRRGNNFFWSGGS